MKKNTFKILINNGSLIEVTGYINNNFGIHKTKYSNNWTVTHLRTGYAIPDINKFKKLKHAKDFAVTLELAVFPVLWDKLTKENAIKNSEKVMEIFYNISTTL